jgi:hypothetical protein
MKKVPAKYIIISLIVIMVVMSYSKQQQPLLTVGHYYDADGNMVQNTQSIVNGVGGITYVDFNVHLHNSDNVTLTLRIIDASPIEFNNSFSTRVVTLNAGADGTIKSGLINITKFQGNQPFCITINSDAIPNVRTSGILYGCVQLTIAADSQGNCTEAYSIFGNTTISGRPLIPGNSQCLKVNNLAVANYSNYVVYDANIIVTNLPYEKVAEAQSTLVSTETLLQKYNYFGNYDNRQKIMYDTTQPCSTAGSTIWIPQFGCMTHETIHGFTPQVPRIVLSGNVYDTYCPDNCTKAVIDGSLGDLNHGGNFREDIVHLVLGDGRWLCYWPAAGTSHTHGEAPELQYIATCGDVLGYKKWMLMCDNATYNGQKFVWDSAESHMFINKFITNQDSNDTTKFIKDILLNLKDMKTPFEDNLTVICPLTG